LRKAVAAEDATDAVSTRSMRPDREPDAARSSMEVGITGGVSLLFGGLDGRR
jgi:hypothetical protein